jgi:ubiquinone/menaquinone biosynthesis C-methylase UbiE
VRDPLNHERCVKAGLKSTSYENYSETSKVYDGTRQPSSGHLLLGLLAAHGGQLQNQAVLDLGCGTANYLLTLWGRVGSYTGLDLNVGMLEQARAKVAVLEKEGENAKSSTQVTFHHGSMAELPFSAALYDAVTLHQCIHHLPKDNDHELLRATLAEAFRVLKPGGVCIINDSTAEQQGKGFWWSAIIPAALARMEDNFVRKTLEDDVLRRMGEATGFVYGGTDVPDGTLQRSEHYLDLKGPFSKTFRDGDSAWALATEEELREGLAEHRRRLDSGAAEAWLAEREVLRKRHGQYFFLHLLKPE